MIFSLGTLQLRRIQTRIYLRLARTLSRYTPPLGHDSVPAIESLYQPPNSPIRHMPAAHFELDSLDGKSQRLPVRCGKTLVSQVLGRIAAKLATLRQEAWNQFPDRLRGSTAGAEASDVLPRGTGFVLLQRSKRARCEKIHLAGRRLNAPLYDMPMVCARINAGPA